MGYESRLKGLHTENLSKSVKILPNWRRLSLRSCLGRVRRDHSRQPYRIRQQDNSCDIHDRLIENLRQDSGSQAERGKRPNGTSHISQTEPNRQTVS